MDKKVIKGITNDEERSYYHLENTILDECFFNGPADGESTLKECRDIEVHNTTFELRYPLWHDVGLILNNIKMTDGCRAALWYTSKASIDNSKLEGIKALRECKEISLNNDIVVSPEFGWKCRDINVTNCDITSEYCFLESSDLTIDNLTFKGKYSFQYVKNATVSNSFLDTKDAFWHTDGVTVINCTVKGEYLGWYASNLTFINCKIIGTQPLCYCKNLILENCEMIDCDLSFEYSNVNATINNKVMSVKNPISGTIKAQEIGEVILEDSIYPCNAKIIDLSKE